MSEKSEITQEQSLNEDILNIDQVKIDALIKELETKTKEFSTKVYAVSMTNEILLFFQLFVQDDANWKGREMLGILEMSKRIGEIRKELDGQRLKNDAIMMTALEIEASHYFLNKHESKGTKGIEGFVFLLKSFESALTLVQNDSRMINSIKNELAAAQQGLESV